MNEIETIGRRSLWGLSHLEGIPFGPPSILDLRGTLVDGHGAPSTYTDCWTHAWKYAKEHEIEYWEGICEVNNQWQVHAWCVKDGKVIEVTNGYETATAYKGFKLSETAKMITSAWDNDPHRSGVLEAFLSITDWPTTRKIVIDTDW